MLSPERVHHRRVQLELTIGSAPLQIKARKPHVYIYCQNPLIEDLSPLQPLLKWGGELKHVENLGRESHAFLLYILQYYHELPGLVLFSQDKPEEAQMRSRIEVIKRQLLIVATKRQQGDPDCFLFQYPSFTFQIDSNCSL